MRNPNVTAFRYSCLLTLAALAGCAAPAPDVETTGEPVEEAPAVPETLGVPNGPFLFQPGFRTEDGDEFYSGTGFAMRNALGYVVGISSAHYLELDGPTLRIAAFLQAPDYERQCAFTHAWGPPGTPADFMQMEMADDYMIYYLELGEVDPAALLELDERPLPDLGETVYFPNKHLDGPYGYGLVECTATDVSPSAIRLTPPTPQKFQACSGTPMISAETGRVIGILTGAIERAPGLQEILVTPIANIREQANTSQQLIALFKLGKEPNEVSGQP